MAETIQKSIEINKDVRTVYDQWTQFEDFPQFMEGIERVEQKDEKHLHWHASIAGVDREWEAEIVEQTPDQVIAWRATGDTRNDGRVTFESVGTGTTRVHLQLDWEPEGLVEKAGDMLNVADKRAEGDLERFKEFIEQRGAETGAWRGEVHEGGTGGTTTGTTP